MQIACWNVNSIRTRLAQVKQWLDLFPDLDLLCLQETKVIDTDFPRDAFESMGWNVNCFGQKSYNGVALISRSPLTDLKLGFAHVLPDREEWDNQKRVISAVYDGVLVVNLYVPNGSAIGSEKYDYKLGWFEVLHEYLQKLGQQYPSIILCGDFNVALEDIDIHDPTDRELKVMASDPERSSLKQILGLGYHDILRKFQPEAGQFSWWDYRSGAFRRNLGWRIDYHFVSTTLIDRVIACTIDPTPRHWTQPSDHAPVILTITNE